MSTGTLLLICGLPGSGKTTLSKKLAVERKAQRLCPDDWIWNILKDPNDISERDRLRDPVEQLLWKEAQDLLQLWSVGYYGKWLLVKTGTRYLSTCCSRTEDENRASFCRCTF